MESVFEGAMGHTSRALKELFRQRSDELKGYVDFAGFDSIEEYAEAYKPGMPGPTVGRDPLEKLLYESQTIPLVDPGSGGADTSRLQSLLSMMVVNPMGYSPEENGSYSWGNLAYIYQHTPSGDISRQLQSWRGKGDHLKADVMERFYGATRRPGEGLDVIRQLTSKYGHGQTDVAMNPDLVQQMMTRRTTDRSKRQYRGGSVKAGLLTSPALGFKRELGG